MSASGLKAGFVVLVLLLQGCGSTTQSGPASTDTKSDAFASLEKKIEFLHRYVTWQRDYSRLDFHIQYANNSEGMIPGPNEWDIKIIAEVPTAQLDAWIPNSLSHQSQKITTSKPAWLQSVPTTIEQSGITEWYVGKGYEIGFDRPNNIVAYRALKM